MTIDELQDWYGLTLGRQHGCVMDHRMQETRPPCPHCRSQANALTVAWRERFPGSGE